MAHPSMKNLNEENVPTLHLSLLGDFQLTCRGQPEQSVHTNRMRALLAYLALHSEAATSRQRLAFLFWPDSEESQARTNLRQLLHHLRQAFPQIERYLDFGSRTIQWRSGAPLRIDVAEFTANIAEAETAAQREDLIGERTHLENAARLYRADLLPECYDEWIEPERDRLRQLLARVLKRLTEILEEQGEFEKALVYAQRLLALDEFDESTYRLLMRLQALNRDRPGALRIYQRCIKVLRDELGMEPSAETRELYDRLSNTAEWRTPLPDESEIPLVGREKERAGMIKAWQTAVAGHTHLLLLSGEAGIGKTRLAEELIRYVQQQGFTTAAARCYAAEGRLAYGPVTEWLKCEAIYRALSGLEEVWQTEVARLLPELLADHPELPAPAPLTESWQRQRLFEALARAIQASAQPLLLFIDDIQWTDPETLEWLHYLLRFEPSAKILVVATLRSGALRTNGALLSLILELRRGTVLSEIELPAIDAAQTALLARHVSGKALDEEAATALFANTEGNPLFIVEMVRSGMGTDHGQPAPNPEVPGHGVLPDKVQAVIQTRLARISPGAKKLLELAAIIGRQFTFDVLSHSSEENEETLIQSLDELWEHRLIREQGQMTYDFSHDKIREVTIAGISRTRRCLLHRRVAEALEKVYEHQLEQVSGQLAAHWENAGFPLRAITYCEQAGQAAQNIFANDDAETHYRRGLRLIRENLQGVEKDRRELTILRLLSPCLVQGRGYGAAEVQKVAARVWELSRQLDEPPGSPLLRMLAIRNLVGGKIADAGQFGLQLLGQAQKEDDPVAEVEAHYVLGVTYHWQGRFSKAREHLRKAIDRYDKKNHHLHITDYAQDPSVICRIRLAMVLWHLGFPDQAVQTGTEALELARQLNHPFSRSYALHWFAWLQNLRNDPATTLEHARTSIAFSEEYHFPYFATQSGILYGWAMFKLGEEDEGMHKMREGLSRFRATGSEIGCAYYRALIAGALAENGSFAQSLALLEEAMTSMEGTDERWSEAAILIMKGTVLRRSSEGESHAQAEAAFRAAITVAQKQGAKTDALRAALELRHLLQNLDRCDEASTAYQEIRQWVDHGMAKAERTALDSQIERWQERLN